MGSCCTEEARKELRHVFEVVLVVNAAMKVVETLASQGADHPFDERILPRRTRGRPNFVDVHRLRELV